MANLFGLPVFLKITKGIVESPSKPKTKSIIVRRLTWSGVLKATAKSCRKIKQKNIKRMEAPTTLKVAVEISFRVSSSFSAKRKNVVSMP